MRLVLMKNRESYKFSNKEWDRLVGYGEIPEKRKISPRTKKESKSN